MRVERFDGSASDRWDDFVRRSKNGTFLFLREYMDYHRDRFEDHSLVVRNDDGEIVALLPGNAKGGVLASHSGLTYGGFVTDEQMKLPKMLEVFEAVLTYLKEAGFLRAIYKCVPHIYHRHPAEEDSYALFLCDARLIRRGALTVVESRHRLPLQERRLRGAKKARKHEIIVRESVDFETYWNILSERLLEAYGARPAHSLEEIKLLHSRFPTNIRLFAAYQQEVMLGGVVIYETENVAHTQYIAASERSRQLGALDLVFEELLSVHYATKKYFDLGTSDEQEGRRLNRGLIDQKEGYGARVVAHDHYEIDLENWVPGSLIQALA